MCERRLLRKKLLGVAGTHLAAKSPETPAPITATVVGFFLVFGADIMILSY